MSESFIDIRITGLDADATQQSPTSRGYRLTYFSLSEAPDNAKFRDLLVNEQRKAEAAQQAEQRERERIEKIGQRLKFD